MFRIRTYNTLSEQGLKRFSERYVVGEEVAEPHAILLRSHSLHDENLPSSVIAIARAGAGTNNIPVEACAENGIVVFNTPGANANAVKEIVLAGLLLSSRGILEGRDFVRSLTSDDAETMHRIVEREKKRFAGSELQGKRLGVIGLGAIGSMVAEAGLALGMEVVGFDPALTGDAAGQLSRQLHRATSLQELLAEVDFATLHVPLLPGTERMIDESTLANMKPDSVVLNFARAPIVDATAVVRALDANRLRRYVCDFPEPRLIGHPKVVALPHLGASTVEAEENCAVMAVTQLCDFLEHGNITNSVNFPATSMPVAAGTARLTFANRNVAGVLGRALTVLADAGVNVVDMVNQSGGEIAYNILDLATAPEPETLRRLSAVDHVTMLRGMS